MQKAVRRGNVTLVEKVVSHLYDIGDRRWLKQRVAVIAFEECWPLGVNLEPMPDLASIIDFLTQVTQSVKFKDAAGLGSLAYALSEGDDSVLSGSATDQDIKIVANAIKRPKDFWNWVSTQCSRECQCALVENAHKSYRRGGWPWDRAFMQTAAYLAVTTGLPVANQVNRFGHSTWDFPFWVALDKHTPQGKKALREAAKRVGIPWRQMNWISFYFESALANAIAPSPWWKREMEWRLNCTGLDIDTARSIWTTTRQVVIEILNEDADRLRAHVQSLIASIHHQMKLF